MLLFSTYTADIAHQDSNSPGTEVFRLLDSIHKYSQ